MSIFIQSSSQSWTPWILKKKNQRLQKTSLNQFGPLWGSCDMSNHIPENWCCKGVAVPQAWLVWPKGSGLELGVNPQGMAVWLNVYSMDYSLELSILLNLGSWEVSGLSPCMLCVLPISQAWELESVWEPDSSVLLAQWCLQLCFSIFVISTYFSSDMKRHDLTSCQQVSDSVQQGYAIPWGYWQG